MHTMPPGPAQRNESPKGGRADELEHPVDAAGGDRVHVRDQRTTVVDDRMVDTRGFERLALGGVAGRRQHTETALFGQGCSSSTTDRADRGADRPRGSVLYWGAIGGESGTGNGLISPTHSGERVAPVFISRPCRTACRRGWRPCPFVSRS